MKALLVYPRFPATYWGFQYALPLTGTKASLPPLGLVTLAAQLPASWSLRLVDENVQTLSDADIAWADVVLVSGMLVQLSALLDVVGRARSAGRLVAVGGPAPTASPERFVDADVVFVGEAEGRIPELVAALSTASSLRRETGPRRASVLRPGGEARPVLDAVPVPRFDLLKIPRYASMAVQYSRGCPFHCEFCDVVELFGHVPRTKGPAQLLGELDALHRLGYRGTVFVVDDNFIGNKRAVRELLAAVEPWQRERGHPFGLFTEASVNLAADRELLDAMVRAGFVAVFLGIETPSREALAEAGKTQNLQLDLAVAVETITATGIEVMGGFIVGFDHDDPSVFEAQRAFIASSPIPLAMVGVLIALPGTALWDRLEGEGRLCAACGGDQFGRPNFVPRMEEHVLLSGYAALLTDLYRADAYYERCRRYVELASRADHSRGVQSARELITLARACWAIGVRSDRRGHFWRLIAHSLRRAPHTFAWSVSRAIMGEHMLRYTASDVLPRLYATLREIEAGARVPSDGASGRPRLTERGDRPRESGVPPTMTASTPARTELAA